MKLTLTLAVLAAVTLAKKHKKDETDVFIDYAVKKMKNYKNVEEFKKCKDKFTKNHNYVEFLNEQALSKKQHVHFADNQFSDMEDDEYEKMLGLVVPEGGLGELGSRLLQDIVEPKGRSLQSDYNVDWVAAGRMHKVKNQGGCGSCWAFAAGTVQEGQQAIKDNTSAVRISEQQAVDCNTQDPPGSCERGGWMTYAWDYWRANGAMSNEDYPYTGKDETCKTVSNSSISTTANYGSFGTWRFDKGYTFNTQQVIDQLQKGPMAVAVNANNGCWKFMDTGILTEEMNCETGVNHAVVLVAYTAAVEGSSGESTFKDVCTTESFEKTCTYETIEKDCTTESFEKTCTDETIESGCTKEYIESGCTTESVMQRCRRATRGEKRAKACKDNLVSSPNKRGRANKKCCSFLDVKTCDSTEEVETCTTTEIVETCTKPDDVVTCTEEIVETCTKPDDVTTCTKEEVAPDGPSTPSTPAYWTLQNSWSSQWGMNGFIRVEVTDGGVGVSGVNQVIEWITVA